jgi:hypothetical protein
LHRVEVQIEAPKENFPGRPVQGMYVVDDKVVILVDHVGNPVRNRDGKTYSKKLEPGEDPRVIAGRLTKQFRRARRGDKNSVPGFHDQIIYPPLGIV